MSDAEGDEYDDDPDDDAREALRPPGEGQQPAGPNPAALKLLEEETKTATRPILVRLMAELNGVVEGGIAPAIAAAGANPEAVRYAAARYCLAEAILTAFGSAWGPSEWEQRLAKTFLSALLRHVGDGVGKAAGVGCAITLRWGRDPGQPPSRLWTPDRRV